MAKPPDPHATKQHEDSMLHHHNNAGTAPGAGNSPGRRAPTDD